MNENYFNNKIATTLITASPILQRSCRMGSNFLVFQDSMQAFVYCITIFLLKKELWMHRYQLRNRNINCYNAKQLILIDSFIVLFD